MNSDYPARIAALINEDALCELGPGEPGETHFAELNSLTVENAFGDHPVSDHNMAACCISGLWLLHNFLDASHSICQDIGAAEGSYWHAILHRREPDYPNAKYWFRRVGDHRVYAPLASLAGSIAAEEGNDGTAFLTEYGDWDPCAFVDFVENAAASGTNQLLARRIAQAEWRLLFQHCYNAAIA